MGALDSPAPVLLWRPEAERREKYKSSDYVSIVLDGRLGTGATGSVYRAVIEPDASSRRPKYSSFVVKVASTVKTAKRLRHEYEIYLHLQKKKVRGIPLAMGFYETKEVGLAILVLSHVGQPLGQRMDKTTKKVEVSKPHA